MTEAEIYAGLTDIFRDILSNESIRLSADTSSRSIEGWDSFSNIIIMAAAEERFGIKMRTAEVEGLKDVGDLVKLIEKKLS